MSFGQDIIVYGALGKLQAIWCWFFGCSSSVNFSGIANFHLSIIGMLTLASILIGFIGGTAILATPKHYQFSLKRIELSVMFLLLTWFVIYLFYVLPYFLYKIDGLEPS